MARPRQPENAPQAAYWRINPSTDMATTRQTRSDRGLRLPYAGTRTC
jgi:hypothetical protein